MRIRKWNQDQLIEAINSSISWASVARKLNLSISGGTVRILKQFCLDKNISIDHFKGRAWTQGIKREGTPWEIPLSEILIENSTFTSSKLRTRLFKAKLKEPKCESCGNIEWLGKPIPLELDHINGNHRDNRLENLRILCCNCHALTPTWRGRNNRKAHSSSG
jgi:hypothetical protein